MQIVGAIFIVAGIAGIAVLFFHIFGKNQIQKSGSNSVNIQSSGSDSSSISIGGGNISITNKNGHIRIKGKVGSVTVNGRKIYA